MAFPLIERPCCGTAKRSISDCHEGCYVRVTAKYATRCHSDLRSAKYAFTNVHNTVFNSAPTAGVEKLDILLPKYDINL